MFYTDRNASVMINGTGIFVSSASLSSDSSAQPNFRIDKAIGTEYLANQGVNGSLSLTYYMTGEDPLKKCLDNDISLSGNFAGLYFNNGRLTRYSLDMAPYGALSVDVEIDFFEQVKGSYVPTPSVIPRENVLTVGDLEFNSSTSIGSDKILSMSYHYDTEIEPRTLVGDVEPTEYRPGRKNVSFSFSSNDLSIDVPLTGKMETATVKLKDSSGNTKETLYINGLMTSQNLATSDNLLLKEVSISQPNLGLEPTITSFTPISGPIGTTVTVNGNYFSNTKKVSLFGIPASFSIVSDTSLQFSVPSDPSGMSGPVRVITNGGEALTTSSFTVS